MSKSASASEDGRTEHVSALPALARSTLDYGGLAPTDEATTGSTGGISDETVRRGSFVIVRPHAKGGLGQVSIARDEKLRRQVALKEIRAERAGDEHLRQRFVTEAEITGQLEHPGIVPIYALDEDAAGNPYYAMRFIQGRTLSEAVAQYWQQPTSLAFRDLLKRFVDICQTVAFAHSRGVIHRDLKPANVMLGDFGETWVVDWGLAKKLGTVSPSGTERAAEPLSVAQDGEQTTDRGQLTLEGQIVGTPAYMAPEQAAGSSTLGPAADVYALGAILYQILTGQAAFAGNHQGDVLARVRQGQFAPPAEVRPAVPKALSAVCLKSMSLRPDQRYSNATDLAADVNRWLADEPIAVFRDPWTTRAARWIKRHKTLVAAGAALLVTAVVVLSIANVLISHETALKEDALIKARNNERTAISNAGIANVQRQRAVKQEGIAKSEASRANAATVVATEQRKLAEARFYASQLKRAQVAAEREEWSVVLEILESVRPKLGEEDRRGFEWYYLWERCHRGLVRRFGGDVEPGMRRALAEIRGLVISPDGQYAAAAAQGRVRLWELASGRELPLPYRPGAWCVAFSPDGKLLAVPQLAQTAISLWEIETRRERRRLPGVQGEVRSIGFSPDGSLLAAGHASVSVWEVESGDLQASVQHPGGVGSLCFTPDSQTLLTSGGDHQIRVWRWREAQWQEMKALPSMGWFSPIAISADGKHLASGQQLALVRELETGKTVAQLDLGTAVQAIAFSNDGQSIALGTQDRTAKIWTPATGQIRAFPHRAGVRGVAFLPGSMKLVAGDDTAELRVWDPGAPGQPAILPHDGVARAVAFSPDGALLAAGADRRAIVWDAKTRERTGAEFVHQGFIKALAFSPDSRLLVVGTLVSPTQGELKVWDVDRGQETASFDTHTGEVMGVTFSPDGRLLYSGAFDGTFQIHDLGAGETRTVSLGGRQAINSLAVSRDGEHLAVGTQHGSVNLCASRTGVRRLEVQSAPGASHWVWSLAFSHDSQQLAAANYSGSITLFDVPSGRPSGVLRGPTSQVRAVRFLRDGRTLVSSGDDGGIRLWDWVTRQERFALNAGNRGTALCLDLHPDETMLAAGGGAGLAVYRIDPAPDALARKSPLDLDDPDSPLAAIELGQQFAKSGQPGDAVPHFLAAIERLSRLAEKAADQTERDRLTALSHLGLVRCYAATEDWPKAEQHALVAVEQLKVRGQSEPADPWEAYWLGDAELHLAEIARQRQQSDVALEWFAKSATALETVVAAQPFHLQAIKMLQHAHSVCGDLHAIQGETGQADRHHARAAELGP